MRFPPLDEALYGRSHKIDRNLGEIRKMQRSVKLFMEDGARYRLVKSRR